MSCRRFWVSWAVLSAVLIIALSLSGPARAQDRRKPVRLEGKKILPLRVLARPFSNIYQDKDQGSATVKENLPAFQAFYVYSRPSPEDLEAEQGWYEVGPDNRGTVLGWMKAEDVFEWKQTMCLAYTHPQGRAAVLMFDSKRPLLEVMKATAEERSEKVRGYYTVIDSRRIPADFPIKSVEPKMAVDIEKEFYLLPILNFEVIELEGREGRLLQLAAATKAGPEARQRTDIREDQEFLDQAVTGSGEVGREVLKKLAVDLVFVMDTTVSMRPYIAKTLDVIRDVSSRITADQDTAQAIRFGIWGYRDSVDDIPGIGYTTKNYTPKLQPVDRFVETLAKVEVTRVDSKDYPEDVFSGMEEALTRTAWTPGAVQVMVLVGDAPGHDLGHAWNLSGQSAETLRALADDQSAYVFSLLVKDPKGKKYHGKAEDQFQRLSLNPGMEGASAFFSLASDDLEGFGQAAADLAEVLRSLVSAAKQGRLAPGLEPEADLPRPSEADSREAKAALDQEDDLGSLDEDEPEPAQDSQAQEAAGKVSPGGQDAAPPEEGGAKALARQMFKAALVEWIGSQAGAMAPRDIVAWAVDKDLLDPAVQSMEVRLLINKRQLDSLTVVLNDVMAAGRRGQIGGEDFFSALQATAATAAREPDQIRNAKTMAQTGLIPEFLLGLPYTSRLMDMTNELWASWGVDEQDEFLNDLEAKVDSYRAIHDRPEAWIALNQGDDPDDHVHPVSLELLP